ncbi:hypothetical protein DXG01_017211 [Tephrocybe rancida]|nr:hypothetical protein DXG01_017211 [Tephrocybe rancida]
MQPGSEPGINPRRTSASQTYGNFKQACLIHVADYDAKDASMRRLGNDELIHMMQDPAVRRDPPSTESVYTPPSGVRWIDIGGLDWQVISAVALKYNLHVLALEDVLHEQGHNQSKADYYHEHLFIRILCHTLEKDDATSGEGNENPIPDSRTEYPGSWLEAGRGRSQEPEKVSGRSPLSTGPPLPTIMPSDANSQHHDASKLTKPQSLSGFWDAAHKRQALRIKLLTKGDRVNVLHEPMSIFLLRNGTVITIHPKADLELTAPIRERLLQEDSLLRVSSDASLLVQALLDLGMSIASSCLDQLLMAYWHHTAVDRALEIMDEYQKKIHQVEHDVLLSPGLDTIRSLHILSGDLIMHKRTLDPIKVMLYSLRHHDLDRCVALAKHAQAEAGLATLSSAPGTPNVQGYLTYTAKLYLVSRLLNNALSNPQSDVSDHMDFILASLDIFAGLSENLINFAFNSATISIHRTFGLTKTAPKTASYEMNQVM